MARSSSLLFTGYVTLAISLSGAIHAGEIRRSPQAIDGQFIVVLKRDAVERASASTIAADMSARFAIANVRRVFKSALPGFSAEMSEAHALELANDPRVAYIQENGRIDAIDVVQQKSVIAAASTQNDAPWGLDRIDQQALPLSGTYSFDGAPANGVDVYVLSTGIGLSHVEFSGRATFAFDAIGEATAEDCNGNGTALASLVGGGRFGVAKGVRLHSVIVLNCVGSGNIEFVFIVI
jgi:hypothetical protein